MAFCQITKEEFLKHCEQVNEKSFFQSVEMAGLLSKRGYDVRYAGFKNSQSEIVQIEEKVHFGQCSSIFFLYVENKKLSETPKYQCF
ncbi:peptidoglycan bridge formation glycyltransferase FemA/FemB family protein [Streptococcus suis]|nr:peptidoglycan bridge formation glycyltransferase FemA/FemB family protein [Streptococcus suis]